MEPWTDITQAIAAIIAIPGAITAFVILFKKDKTKESQISSLSIIANQLTQMQEETEKRYKTSKKPTLNIDLSDEKPKKRIIIEITNTNSSSTLRSYNLDTRLDGFTLTKTTINQQNTTQSFRIGISYMAEPPECLILHMEYITEEDYIFIQEIIIFIEKGKYVFSPSAIIDKINSFDNGK